jgi:hypothetical protein
MAEFRAAEKQKAKAAKEMPPLLSTGHPSGVFASQPSGKMMHSGNSCG